MAFMHVIGPCAACGRIISYHPSLVPSVRIDGHRQAVCASCVDRWNELHPEQPDIIPHADAYEAQEVV